jgi:hypothetical protein
VVTEFLLTGVLLPLFLIAVSLGLERIEEDLNRSAPPGHRQRPVVDGREETGTRTPT